MPHYFFDVRDGTYMPDREGTELAGLAAARVAAVELAGALLKDNPAKFWDGDDWRIEVKDDGNVILFVLHFSATDSAAVSRQSAIA